MIDEQMDSLIENSRRAFVNELRVKILEIEELLNVWNCEGSKNELNRLSRFFHSINGTASTLGLNYLSSIGKKWEDAINDVIINGQSLDIETLQSIATDLNIINESIANINERGCSAGIPAEDGLYENIRDRGRILLIDDDITILKLLENAFSVEGYKVYICDDSASAMDIIALARPEVIILDIMMPKVDGYELMKQIKSRPEYSDICVIFLSAKGETHDRIKGLKSGADDYIVKPFVIGEIITRVEILMRRLDSYKEKLLKDSLTDTYSRYYFNYRISEEHERYRRNNTVFSVAFVDLDHFKYVNDEYGHQTGDRILIELSSYIVRNIRKCDSIYRYGGEEFIVLLPDTNKENAFMIIDRLRYKLGCEPVRVGGLEINVTFSAGIKQICDVNESTDKIVGDADKAMYYAKKCGRNRVVVHSNEINMDNLNKTLLIVDDESTILKLLRDKLSNTGYNIVTAKDGGSAIAIAQEIHPDAMVLDLILPDIDGFEVCRHIKENINTRSIKIIMLSKKKHQESIIKGLHCGADDYVTKPFSMDELEARIIRVMNSIE